MPSGLHRSLWRGTGVAHWRRGPCDGGLRPKVPGLLRWIPHRWLRIASVGIRMSPDGTHRFHIHHPQDRSHRSNTLIGIDDCTAPHRSFVGRLTLS